MLSIVPFLFGILFQKEKLICNLTISYQKPFVISVLVFCFQIISHKINFMAKNRSDLCSFNSKLDFFY